MTRAQPPLNLAQVRQEYMQAGLSEADALSDPIAQFERWMADVLARALPVANAMTLATVNSEGRPDARIVLLKGIEHGGFVFYTNYNSAKGQQLDQLPHACLVFLWTELERQVRIDGRVEKVSPTEADSYYASRPLGARQSAWASAQSTYVTGRSALEKALDSVQKKYPQDPPRPPYWGGYRVIPERIEFWQGRPNRLHDRLQYLRDGNGWTLQRLAP